MASAIRLPSVVGVVVLCVACVGPADPGGGSGIDDGKDDSWRPRPDQVLREPEIIISLDQLTLHVFDRTSGFNMVYPVGVGVFNRDAVSVTPTGQYHTGPDISDTWYYIARRTEPAYYGGYPFIRLDCPNPNGDHTYGIHGPIRRALVRGYISHGCILMEGEDVRRVFELVYRHASTPVTIQREPEVDAAGNIVDVGSNVVLFGPSDSIPVGPSIRDPRPFDDTGTDGEECIDDRFEQLEAQAGSVPLQAPGFYRGLLYCPGDPQDRFSVDLPVGPASIAIEGFTPVVSNLDLRVLDPSGQLVAQGTNRAEPFEEIAFDVGVAGTYQVEVFEGPNLSGEAEHNGYSMSIALE